MRLPIAVLLLASACNPITPLKSDGGDAGADDGGSVVDGGSGLDAGLSGTVFVEPLLDARSRLGARSVAGFRPWRGGIAVISGSLYWVESGTAAGLYRMPVAGCAAGTCPERITALTRPSVFTATSDAVLVADVTTLKRYAATGGAGEPVATGSSELVLLASDGVAAFWATERAPIFKTPFGGATSTIINSNGTPFAMTIAGDRVQWVGVDISGLQVVMQSIRTAGTGAREERRFGNGFQTMKGDSRYLYFARDSMPATVLRQTVSNGLIETIALDAQGVTDFALDDQYAWWVEPGSSGLANGRLRRVAHESVKAETVAEAIPWPVGVAVSGGVAYVLSAGTQAEAFADGKILRVSYR
ncbi:MAG: hypothetical protein GQE15_14810 [Archangiaceae bacterium]|nr:hypothetical protein [Archangiaceae bacterium]